MVSKGKRKNLVKLYPRQLGLNDLIVKAMVAIPFPTHMLYGMTRQEFRHKNPQHQLPRR